MHNRGPRFSFGIEWGASFPAATHHNDVFISSEGYRVEQNRFEYSLHMNGDLMASAGINFAMKHNASLVGGWSGLSEGLRFFPLSLRYTFARNGISRDGMICFLSAGIGFPENRISEKLRYTGSLGAGYRLAFNDFTSLDLKCSIRNTIDHPGIVDPDTGKMVTGHNVRMNNAFHYALCITAAVNF